MVRVSGASHLLAQNPPQPTSPRTELAQIRTGHDGLSGSVCRGQAGPRRRSESSSTIRERRDSSATEPLFLKHAAMDCQSKECIRCDGREQQRYEWRSSIRGLRRRSCCSTSPSTGLPSSQCQGGMESCHDISRFIWHRESDISEDWSRCQVYRRRLHGP